MTRRAAALAILALALAGCGILEPFTGESSGDGGILGGDPIDTGLGALQWGLSAAGLGSLGAVIKMMRVYRAEKAAPSRAAGDVAQIRHELEIRDARFSDLEGRVGRLELVLMARGLDIPLPTGA